MPPRKQTPMPLPTDNNTDADTIVDGPAKAAAEITAGALAAVNASEECTEEVGRKATSVSQEDFDAKPSDMDLTTIHTYEDAAPARPKSKAWTVVADLSDDEFQVEVANIDGFQMRKCLLRFRVDGVLSPTIQVMEGIRYHGEKGFQSR